MATSTPDYVLTEDHNVTYNSTEGKILLAGSFVRPIEIQYVPKHITDSAFGRWFNKNTEIYCYTRYGIVPIPRNILRIA